MILLSEFVMLERLCWLVRMVDEDMDVAALEPERETLRSRRGRAAYADVMDELDNMVSDIDDK
jgi:hypothetical protein